jgi:hypothetical protein
MLFKKQTNAVHSPPPPTKKNDMSVKQTVWGGKSVEGGG